MPVRINTDLAAKGFAAAIRQVDELLDAFGSEYEVWIGTSEKVSARLAYFTEGTTRGTPARPVMVYNEVARERVERAMQQSFQVRGRVNVLVQLTAGAHAFRDLIVERLNAGGGDVRLDALAPSTARQKARKGWPGTPGVASGAMRDAIAGAQVFVRKRR